MKETQIEKIKKMIADGKSPDAISNEIDSTLEDILKECATLTNGNKLLSEAIEAAKVLMQIYTNEENQLEWYKSEAYGKIIVHNALMNHGQILVENFSRQNADDKSVVINGVTMKVRDAVEFFDDLIHIHQSLTKRFFFDKMNEPDEEISEPIANAMHEYIKKRSF